MSEVVIIGVCTGVNNRLSKDGKKFCILNLQLANGNSDFYIENHLPVYKMGTLLRISACCRIFDHKCNGFEDLTVEEVKAQ